MKKINKNTVEVNTINRGVVLISFPFIALETDGMTFDVAPKTEDGERYLISLKENTIFNK